ncbi:pyruvate formate-lyase-activating protein [Pectinatus sottacetonis]|uniref:pyruvate formate-lyase-activating protein n=1 Tax=Pectinatus sottacetonis TaxID=1002795 RepID=UPI0018C45CF4
MKGYYHSKETFGTVDGAGIRYVLFLAGCNLQCAFCHNPDTWKRGSKMIGSQEVINEVNEYRSFYEASGGGFTMSGGEPMMQPEFVAEVFHLCKKNNISTTLDTSGLCAKEAFMKVLPYTDHVLFSLKAALPALHRKLTTVKTNTAIIENLCIVAKRKPVTLRYVVMPGITDSEIEIAAFIHIIRSLPAIDLSVDLLPYHKMGIPKWKALKMPYSLDYVEPPRAEVMAEVKVQLTAAGIRMAY